MKVQQSANFPVSGSLLKVQEKNAEGAKKIAIFDLYVLIGSLVDSRIDIG